MAHVALVIMAAGIGSRFGDGIKQLEPVGPGGEIIMDYSIYDAIEAGFDKIVFVIRKDLEKDFKEIIGNRIEKVVEVDYVFQEKENISEPFKTLYADRKKPWGTGHAVLCCKDIVKEPFLVINADDYYGKESYKVAFKYLTENKSEFNSEKEKICMVGFALAKTLSENGSVTRGICQADETNTLTSIVETYNIVKTENGAAVRSGDVCTDISMNSLVSMNMWGFHPHFFEILESGFWEFLENVSDNYEKAEYLLPSIIGNLLKEKKADVKVLPSKDKWFGVTYKEDKHYVTDSIRKLVTEGAYPNNLFPKSKKEDCYEELDDKYKKSYEYLEQYAKDNQIKYYEIVEDTYEYEDGLMLICYDDEKHEYENHHICIDVTTM